MSTKIYNGYKITASSLDEVVAKLFGNKDQFKELIDSKIQEDILTRAINNYYSMCFSTFIEQEDDENKKNQSPFGKVISDALDNELDSQLKERDTVDVSICILPKKQTVNNENYYLLMLYAGQYSNIITESSLWNSLDIEEFAYWDNTDPPEELTEYEWSIREKQWEKELGYNIPAQSSLVIEYKKEYKYNCIYAKGKETLTPIFEKNFEHINLKKIQTSLLAYYEEMIKDKIAYKACYEKYSSEQLSDDTKNNIYRESRKYSRENKYTEEEMKEVTHSMTKIKEIFKQPISLEQLFDKKDHIKDYAENIVTNKTTKTAKIKR